jgi:hypothetical protein
VPSGLSSVTAIDAGLEHLTSVELGAEAIAERRPPAVRSRHDSDGVGGAVGGHDFGAGQPLADETRALSRRLRMREDSLDPLERYPCACDQAVADRVDDLAHDRDPVGVERERVEGDVDRAFERVLDRHDRPFGPSFLNGHHAVVDTCLRNGLERRPVGRGEQRLLGEGALGPEEGDAYALPRTGSAQLSPLLPLASAVWIASFSSGESSNSDLPSCTPLT